MSDRKTTKKSPAPERGRGPDRNVGEESKTALEQNRSISWRASEYRYVEKGSLWYAIVFALVLFFIVFALVQSNFFFALFILIAGVIVFYLGNRRPRVLDFEINDEGIRIGKSRLYPYDGIEGFAIYERPQQLGELVLKRKTTINPYVRIPIDSQLSPQVRSFLAQKLSEISYEPSIIDILADWLGF
jgi:hypothetical protein